MNKIVLMIACLFCATVLFAQTKDEQAIKTAMGKQVSAWNKGNIDVFMETYWNNDSLLFIGKGGNTYGWKTTLDNYKKRYPDLTAMGKLNFDSLQLRPLGGEYYFVIGNWHLQRTIGDIGGVFTLLFKKIKGSWFIVVDHTS